MFDPNSDKVKAVVNLSSTALGFAPQTPEVQSLSIVTGSVGLFNSFRTKMVTPVGAELDGAKLAFQALGLIANHFGMTTAAHTSQVAAFLLQFGKAFY